MQPNTDSLSSVRKPLLPKDGPDRAVPAGEVYMAGRAVPAYTSDDPDHPIESRRDT